MAAKIESLWIQEKKNGPKRPKTGLNRRKEGLKRMRTQVLGLEGIDFQPDQLRFLVADNDAEAGGEELRRVEIGGQRETLKLNVDIQYAVQRIDLQRAVAVLAQQVPPAFEDLQRVGLHVVEIRYVVILHPVRFVAECQHLVVAHRLQDGGQGPAGSSSTKSGCDCTTIFPIFAAVFFFNS